MESILNSISDYVLIINENGKVEFLNEKIIKEFKVSIEYKDKIEKHINIKEIEFKYKNQEEVYVSLPIDGKTIKFLRGKIIKDKWKDKEAYFLICKSKELFNMSDKVKKLFNLLPFMLIIKDSEGKYVYTNEHVEPIFNFKKDYMIGKRDEELFDEGFVNQILHEDEEVRFSKQPKTYEKYNTKKDGAIQWFKSHKIPVIYKDNVEYIITLMENKTVSKNLEKRLIESYDKLKGGEITLDSKSLYPKFNNFENLILKELGADGINIWIYNEAKKELVSEYICGICRGGYNILSEISLTDEQANKLINNHKYNGINKVSSVTDEKRRMLAEKLNIEYIGAYHIKFDDKLLGMMIIAYGKGNKPNFTYDDDIRKACAKIGIILKNYKLSNEVNRELEKRMEIEEEMEHFLDTATDLMAIVDNEGSFVKVNNGWATSLGWTKSELLNLKWQELIVSDDLELTNKMIEIAKFNDGKIRRVINRYRGKSDNIAWLDWGFKYIKEKDLLIVTARDITDKKRIEEQKKVYEKTIELESVKNEFFSNISHEFKTPLNIILATIQLIIKGIDNNYINGTENFDLKKYAVSIKQNSYRLLRLINNLIDITKIDAGYYKVNLENHDIVSIVEDITTSVAEYVENKGIKLVFDTEVEEEVIACDPDKIERIMLNLLSNAIKYTGTNGEIEVYMKVEEYKVIVSVKDNGIGIPSEKLKTIFDRFIQVDNSLTRECEGSGIGLSLVKALVEMHGGEVNVTSEQEKGTEFKFSLPISLVDSYDEVAVSQNTLNCRVEKCNIEFSDIYKL